MAEITLAHQGTQQQSTHIPSVQHFTLIWNLLDSPNVHHLSFSNLWYAARAQNKVPQTIRKQYKHTIAVFLSWYPTLMTTAKKVDQREGETRVNHTSLI